jgi:hypothetical protein
MVVASEEPRGITCSTVGWTPIMPATCSHIPHQQGDMTFGQADTLAIASHINANMARLPTPVFARAGVEG